MIVISQTLTIAISILLVVTLVVALFTITRDKIFKNL